MTREETKSAAEGAERGWFRRWFGPEYLALYPHRDREEAERGVRLFAEVADVPPGGRLLDVGCGPGRHLAAFRERGLDPVGLDLSRPLLRRARETTDGRVPLVRGDMRRLPLTAGSFEAVTSFFTSFGYFESPEEDRRVLDEMRRVLRPGGTFLLDFLNAEQVRRELVPEEEDVVRGRTVRQSREIRDGCVVKRIEIESEGEASPSVFHERVRLYEPGELTEMLEEASLSVRARYGDYTGDAHDARAPRFIVVGRAA